jgi:hypothetical protein
MITDHKKHSLGIHWGWVVLGTSFITLFINYSIRIGAYSVLLPKMIQDLGINMTQAGMIRAGARNYLSKEVAGTVIGLLTLFTGQEPWWGQS